MELYYINVERFSEGNCSLFYLSTRCLQCLVNELNVDFTFKLSSCRLPLQSYFYEFCDLRKEIQKFFNTGTVKNLDDMLYYLMLDGRDRGTGTEYGVNKCYDMVAIIACLLNAGCPFTNTEKVWQIG